MTCDGSGWISPGWLGTPPDPSERERGCPDCGGTGVDEPWDIDSDLSNMDAPPEEHADAWIDDWMYDVFAGDR